MFRSIPTPRPALRPTALATCFALMFAGASHPGSAAQLPSKHIAQSIDVTSCDDAGPGSLRDAIAGAGMGDTIDLTHLPEDCSTITLETGAIAINVDGLVINGPGEAALTIDGGDADRVFVTDYSITLNDVTVAHGYDEGGIGGCVFALGDVSLTRSTLSGCRAGSASTTYGFGGGIFTTGALSLTSSALLDNVLNSTITGYGGAAHAGGDVTLTDSVVSGNSVVANEVALGGALSAYADFSATRSTVSGNGAESTIADALGGGVFVAGASDISATIIVDNHADTVEGTALGGGVATHGDGAMVISDASIVSGNSVHSETKSALGGGIADGSLGHFGGTVSLFGSTIADNASSTGCDALPCAAAGGGVFAFAAIAAEHSVIRDNRAFTTPGSVGHALGGGLGTSRPGAYGAIVVRNTTVSGNSALAAENATGFGGGLGTADQSPFLAFNSTIAFNHASSFGGGAAGSDQGGVAPKMISSIAASNAAPDAADVASNGNPFTLAGDHNLILDAGDIDLPADTLMADPKLLPLGNHGGSTRVLPLAACSPAVDAGSNDDALEADQRGAPFVREFGMQADIGAFELQPFDDRIAYRDFEVDPCTP